MPLAGLAIGIIAVIIALFFVAKPLLLCLVRVIGFGVIGPVAGMSVFSGVFPGLTDRLVQAVQPHAFNKWSMEALPGAYSPWCRHLL